MSNKEFGTSEQVSTVAASSTEKSNSRRKFFKKAAIGATIASIPTRSVWANGVISGHISGNVSGASDVCDILSIWSYGKYKTPTNNGRIRTIYHDYTWEYVFGTLTPYGNASETMTLEQIINHKGKDADMRNAQLATMYINTQLHGSEGVFWPVVANGSFATAEDYVQYLYPFASQISDIIDEHHAPGFSNTNGTESCYNY